MKHTDLVQTLYWNMDWNGYSLIAINFYLLLLDFPLLDILLRELDLPLRTDFFATDFLFRILPDFAVFFEGALRLLKAIRSSPSILPLFGNEYKTLSSANKQANMYYYYR